MKTITHSQFYTCLIFIAFYSGNLFAIDATILYPNILSTLEIGQKNNVKPAIKKSWGTLGNLENIKQRAKISIYVPPLRGAPRYRIGGGTRSSIRLPEIVTLTPLHTGLTVKPSPILYFYLSEKIEKNLHFTLINTKTGRQVHASTIIIANKGIHSVNLAKLNIELLENIEYMWNISLKWAGKSGLKQQEITSDGYITYIPVSGLFIEKITQLEPRKQIFEYGKSSYWYDTLNVTMKLIGTNTNKMEGEYLLYSLLSEADIFQATEEYH